MQKREKIDIYDTICKVT